MRLHPLSRGNLRRHYLSPTWLAAQRKVCAPPLHEHHPYPLTWPHSGTCALAQEESQYQVKPKRSTQQQLQETFTTVCAMLRLALPAQSWRDYLLPLLLLKCLSDDWLAKRASLTHAHPAQPDAIARGMTQQKLVLPLINLPRLARAPHAVPQESCLASFETLHQRRNLVEIGVYIDQVLHALEEANPLLLRGVFAHLSYSNVRHQGGSVQRHSLWHAILSELGRLELGALAAQTAFAEAWHQLLSAQQGASRAAQQAFVSQLLLRLWQPHQQLSFCDPFCGNASFLLQMHGAMAHTYAQEADIAQLASARMSGIVADIFGASAAASAHAPALASAAIHWQHANSLRQPILQQRALRQFDLQASNLCRYSLRWEHSALRDDFWQRFRFGVSPRGKPELLCICHMLACATPHRGKFALMVQLGCLYRTGNEQSLRHKLLQENALDAVIILPGMRKGAHQSALLLFDLSRTAKACTDVWLMDANQLAPQEDAKAMLEAHYVEKLYGMYARRSSVAGLAVNVSAAQMAAQGDSWLPTTYLPAAHFPSLESTDALAQEITELEQAVLQARERLLHALAYL